MILNSRSNPHVRKLLSAISALGALLLLLSGIGTASITSAQTVGLPLDQPARGLIFAGLERAVDPACRGMFRAQKTGMCTHGPDPAPVGVNIEQSVAPILSTARIEASLPAGLCDGDGTSGARTQLLYARASDHSDRYTDYLALFQQLALQADQIYLNSAAETGGSRHIRFVHDASCNLVIPDVALSPSGDDTFDNTIAELRAKGYNRIDRKYMIFVDANIYCGIGELWGDDQPGQANANNAGPSYARSDAACWFARVIAHEHMHNLGGVQLSAPHSSGAYHCVDEYDVMCYSDGPYFPPMQYLCSDSSRDSTRFDCKHDDYYSTNPPTGTYLATHWNAANNRFLIGANTCPDAYEPDNSPGQAREIGVGSTQNHAFCIVGDVDWVSFSAMAGVVYRLETLNLAPGTDTYLSLYQSNGTTLIASDDNSNGALASLITFTPGTSGRYYLKVRHNNSSAGAPSYTYQLRVTALNRLGNPNFEDDTNADGRPDSWSTSSTLTRSSTANHSGNYAGKFSATDSLRPSSYQIVSNLKAGATYHFSGWVNIPNTGEASVFKFQVSWRNAGNRIIRTDTIKTYTVETGGWNQAVASLTAPVETTSAQILLVCTNLNTAIYVDDISFGP